MCFNILYLFKIKDKKGRFSDVQGGVPPWRNPKRHHVTGTLP